MCKDKAAEQRDMQILGLVHSWTRRLGAICRICFLIFTALVSF